MSRSKVSDIADELGFAEISNTMQPHGEGYLAVIPESWRQGRTCYGGLTAGLAVAAATRRFENLPPLRSANVTFVGPVSGAPVFTPKLLRRGRNVTMIEVSAKVGEEVVGTVTCAFGAARKSELSAEITAPPAPHPADCEPFTAPQMSRFVPGFFHRFETQLIEGGRPVSGADEGYIRAWSRHTDPDSREGTASFVTLSDVLPPAAMPMFTKMGPVSSMTFLLNILDDTPTTKDGWWQIETRQTAARGGYSTQIMRFFDNNGRLVAEGLQSVAIFV